MHYLAVQWSRDIYGVYIDKLYLFPIYKFMSVILCHIKLDTISRALYGEGKGAPMCHKQESNLAYVINKRVFSSNFPV